MLSNSLLGLGSFNILLFVLLIQLGCLSSLDLSIGINSIKSLCIGREILSLSAVELSWSFGRLNFLLDLVRVDDLSEVGVSDEGSL